MRALTGSEVTVEMKINKRTAKYTVTILDGGEKIGCTEIDANGDNLRGKIVEWISGQMSGQESEEAQLTKKGEMEFRHEAVTFDPLEKEEEDDEGYNPLNEDAETDPFDAGYGI
jgi:hypothetical protein